MNEKKENFSVTNPGLHRYYVGQAVLHLTHIDKALKKFYSFSNLNMHGPTEALNAARAQLVRTDQAYTDADVFLQISRTGKDFNPIRPVVEGEDQIAEVINDTAVVTGAGSLDRAGRNGLILTANRVIMPGDTFTAACSKGIYQAANRKPKSEDDKALAKARKAWNDAGTALGSEELRKVKAASAPVVSNLSPKPLQRASSKNEVSTRKRK